MAYSFRHTNPELAGTIIREKVRCNRQNCHCMRLNRLHKWYYYLYWRDYKNRGLLRKQYIPRNEVRELKRKIKSLKVRDVEEKRNLGSYLKILKELL